MCGVGGVGMLSSPLAMASPYSFGASDPDEDTIPSVLYGKGKTVARLKYKIHNKLDNIVVKQ